MKLMMMMIYNVVVVVVVVITREERRYVSPLPPASAHEQNITVNLDDRTLYGELQ